MTRTRDDEKERRRGEKIDNINHKRENEEYKK